MSDSKKFAFDVGITFIASIISMLIGFMITVLLGRYLGADDLGLYRMVSTIYGMAMLFAAIGIPAAIIKYVAEFKDNRTKSNAIVSSGIITSLFLGILFSVLFYFSSGIFEEIFKMSGLSGLLRILSPVFPFALVGGVLLGFLNGLREMKKCAMVTVFQSVLMIVVSVLLIYFGFGVTGVVIGVVLASVGWCFYLLWVSKNYFKITTKGYIQETIDITRFGSKVFVAGAINEINNKLDLLLIGFFLVASDVGYYAVAIGLSRFFWIIPLSVQRVTYPATSEYWSKNNHTMLNNMINQTIKYCTVILLPIGLGVGFLAKEIIVIIFNEDFIYAALPLQILLIGTVIRGCIGQPIGGSLSGIGKPGLILKIIAIITTINLTLDIILIPKIGIIGAAIATTIALVSGSFIGLYLTVNNLNVDIDIKWLLNILGVTLIAIILYKFGILFVNPFLLTGIIIIGYSILIFKFFLTKKDTDLFKSLTHSLIHRR